MRKIARASRRDSKAKTKSSTASISLLESNATFFATGTLDFPDEVLSQLDFVVASVHSALGLSEADMTRRMIRAMENPFVTMLAHPTGSFALKREPYKIDVPKILDAAARTGYGIELNAAPKRLDLDWRWWPMAKPKGVKCVIKPGRASRRAFAGFMVRNWHRAQRLAHERRRDELFAAGKMESALAAKEAGVANKRSPPSRQSAGVV